MKQHSLVTGFSCAKVINLIIIKFMPWLSVKIDLDIKTVSFLSLFCALYSMQLLIESPQ